VSAVTLFGMSPESAAAGAVRPSAAEANEAIREFVAVVDGDWSREALTELARLRALWRRAVARERLVRAA